MCFVCLYLKGVSKQDICTYISTWPFLWGDLDRLIPGGGGAGGGAFNRDFMVYHLL